MNPRERLLRSLVQEALAEPVSASLRDLWVRIEPILAEFPDMERLQIAGYMIAQLAEIYHAKAEKLLGIWQLHYSDDLTEQEPLIDEEFLLGLVQQTMYLDLSKLIESKPPTRRRKFDRDSVVGQVEKQKLLKMVDLEQAKRDALSVAYDEDISAWSEAIAVWLSQQQQQLVTQGIWFSHLSRSLHEQDDQLTPVKVFLALLLSGYPLEQPGAFYESDILVFQKPEPGGEISQRRQFRQGKDKR